MMKQEKYINYIVGDLIKKSTMENRKLFYPTGHMYTDFFYHTPSNLPHFLGSFIVERYGASNDELETIWELYRDGILKLMFI